MMIRDIVQDLFYEAKAKPEFSFDDGELKRYLVTSYVVSRFGEVVPTKDRTIEMMDEMYQWLDYHLDMHEQN